MSKADWIGPIKRKFNVYQEQLELQAEYDAVLERVEDNWETLQD